MAKKIKLLDGSTLEWEGDNPPALQDVKKVKYACDVCPIKDKCKGGNEWDCQVYGMFTGFYCGYEDVLKDLLPNK